MNRASVSVFIDTRFPKKNGKDLGKCLVKIRVTHQRQKKYYATSINLSSKDFARIMSAKRRSDADKEIYNEIHSFENKAIKVIEALPVFTFVKFEEAYLSNKQAADSIAVAFDAYAKELREEKRIGTAVSYECAKASFEKFKPDLRFADITPKLLRRYENWMLENGNNITSVGIYVRSLRTIFNRASVDKVLYPFGEGNKYSIPRGRNIKKALTLAEISKIFHYEAVAGSTCEMARDYWVFSYLCNGLNIKDFCFLKRKNIDDDILTYVREKTKRNKKEVEPIIVSLKPEAKAIINTWGVPTVSSESYIFPHLQKGMTAEKERNVVKQLTKTINKYMKRIAKELQINKEVTTYFARHSFSSVLKNSGVSVEFISEALGHGNVATTKAYLAGFETQQIHETTNALTAFSK